MGLTDLTFVSAIRPSNDRYGLILIFLLLSLLLLCIYDVRQPVEPSGNTYYRNVRKNITASGYKIIILQ